MCELPPKKPNIKEKKPNNFFDANGLQKTPNLWNLASKKPVSQPRTTWSASSKICCHVIVTQ